MHFFRALPPGGIPEVDAARWNLALGGESLEKNHLS